MIDNSRFLGVVTLKSPGGVFVLVVFPIRKQITDLIFAALVSDLFMLPHYCMKFDLIN